MKRYSGSLPGVHAKISVLSCLTRTREPQAVVHPDGPDEVVVWYHLNAVVPAFRAYRHEVDAVELFLKVIAYEVHPTRFHSKHWVSMYLSLLKSFVLFLASMS